MEKPLTVNHKEIVYQDRNQFIQRVIAEFSGFNKEYFVSDHGQRAAILVVDSQDNVLLTRQYRLIINDISYEIPGGRVEHDETPEQTAVRECLEETGVFCRTTIPLLRFNPCLDIWKNYTHIFLSTDFEGPRNANAAQTVWLPLGKCLEMIKNGHMSDSLSIIAIFTYALDHIQQSGCP